MYNRNDDYGRKTKASEGARTKPRTAIPGNRQLTKQLTDLNCIQHGLK